MSENTENSSEYEKMVDDSVETVTDETTNDEPEVDTEDVTEEKQEEEQEGFTLEEYKICIIPCIILLAAVFYFSVAIGMAIVALSGAAIAGYLTLKAEKERKEKHEAEMAEIDRRHRETMKQFHESMQTFDQCSSETVATSGRYDSEPEPEEPKYNISDINFKTESIFYTEEELRERQKAHQKKLEDSMKALRDNISKQTKAMEKRLAQRAALLETKRKELEAKSRQREQHILEHIRTKSEQKQDIQKWADDLRKMISRGRNGDLLFRYNDRKKN